MDKTALVNPDIERGREVLDALDAAKMRVAVALWAFWSEYEDWRLVISGRPLDAANLRDAYLHVNDRLTSAGLTAEKLPPILILPMDDPSIRALRRAFSKAKSVQGKRLGGQMIGDRFLEDSFVYRIS